MMSIFKNLFICLFSTFIVFNATNVLSLNLDRYGEDSINDTKLFPYFKTPLIDRMNYLITHTIEIHLEKKDNSTSNFLAIYNLNKIFISTQLLGNVKNIRKIWFEIDSKRIELTDLRYLLMKYKSVFIELDKIPNENNTEKTLLYTSFKSISELVKIKIFSTVINFITEFNEFFYPINSEFYPQVDVRTYPMTKIDLLDLTNLTSNQFPHGFYIIGKVKNIITYSNLTNVLLNNQMYYFSIFHRTYLLGILKNNVFSNSDIGSPIVYCNTTSCKMIGQIIYLKDYDATYETNNHLNIKLPGFKEKDKFPISVFRVNLYSIEDSHDIRGDSLTPKVDPVVEINSKKSSSKKEKIYIETKQGHPFRLYLKPKIVDKISPDLLGATSSNESVIPNLTSIKSQTPVKQVLSPPTDTPLQPYEGSSRKRTIQGQDLPTAKREKVDPAETHLEISESNQRKRQQGTNESQLIHEITSQKLSKPIEAEIGTDTTANFIPSNDNKEIKEITANQLFEDCYRTINLFDINETNSESTENKDWWIPNIIEDLPKSDLENLPHNAIQAYNKKPIPQEIQSIEKVKNVRLTFVRDNNYIYKVFVITGNHPTDSTIDVVLLNTGANYIYAFKCSKNIIRPILETSVRNIDDLTSPFNSLKEFEGEQTFYKSKYDSSTLQNEKYKPDGIYHTTDDQYFQVINYPKRMVIHEMYLKSKDNKDRLTFSDQEKVPESVLGRLFYNYTPDQKTISNLTSPFNSLKEFEGEQTFYKLKYDSSTLQNEKYKPDGIYHTTDDQYFQVINYPKRRVIHEMYLKSEDNKDRLTFSDQEKVPESVLGRLFYNYTPDQKTISELDKKHRKMLLVETTTLNHSNYNLVTYRLSRSTSENFIKKENRADGVYSTQDNRYFEVKNKVIHELKLKDESKNLSMYKKKTILTEQKLISLFSNYEPLTFNTLNTYSKDVDQVVINEDDKESNNIYGIKNPSNIEEDKYDFIPNDTVYLNLWEYSINSLGIVEFKLIKILKSKDSKVPKPTKTKITIHVERNSKNYLLDAVKSAINELSINYR